MLKKKYAITWKIYFVIHDFISTIVEICNIISGQILHLKNKKYNDILHIILRILDILYNVKKILQRDNILYCILLYRIFID